LTCSPKFVAKTGVSYHHTGVLVVGLVAWRWYMKVKLIVLLLCLVTAASVEAATYGSHVSGLWKDFYITDAVQTGMNSVQGIAFDPTSQNCGVYDKVYTVNASTETHRGVYYVDIYNETYSNRLDLAAVNSLSDQTDVAVDSSGTVYVVGIGAPYVFKVEDASSGSPTVTQMIGDYGGTGDDDIESVAMVPSGFGGAYTAGSDLLLFDYNLNGVGTMAVSVVDKDSTLVSPVSSTVYSASTFRILGDASSIDGSAYFVVRGTLQTADLGGVNRVYVNRTKSDGVLERVFLNIDADEVPAVDDAIAINQNDGSLWLNINDGGTRNIFRVDVANAVLQTGTDYLAEATLEIGDSVDLGKNGMDFSPDGRLLALCVNAGRDRMLVYNVTEPGAEGAEIAEIAGIIASFEDADDGNVLIVAHRGDHKTLPENSIDAMLSAVDIGAQIVEVDVGKTKDDVFILMHDVTIDRTTNGSGTVSELTLAEIQAYYLYYPSGGGLSDLKVPTLQDTMLALKGKCIIRLDKSNYYLEECADLARSCGVEKQVIIKSSGSDAEILALLNDNPDIYYGTGAISQEGYESKLETFGPVGLLELISISYEYESSWLITSAAQVLSDQYDVRVQSNSLNASPEVSAGHIDSEALIDPDANWGWQINHGIDIIQTDEPEALKNYLCSIGKHYCYFDGTTDMSDFGLFSQSWLTDIGDPDYDCKWDLVQDGTIDIADLSFFSFYWLSDI
jgi:glycerophosphoryl diester phosphodiesterase